MGANLTWLRPDWLWGLVPLIVLCVFWWRRRNAHTAWEAVVDPDLQPYVIEGDQHSRSGGPWVLFFAWGVGFVLLAGPVWQQQEVPVFQAEQAEIVVFDLSQSMRLDDMAPNRLTRARFKLLDLLDRSAGRQTGLIVFAERPYIVSPLTEDARTVAAFVPSLDSDIMPVQGSRLDLAIERSVMLFEQSSVTQGHIIAITDSNVLARDLAAARAARAAGHRLSVLAVGTATGSPLRDEQGQFVRRADGSVVVPMIDMPQMQNLAAVGGGLAVWLTTNSDDLNILDGVRDAIAIGNDTGEAAMQQFYWVEYAPWCLWILVPTLLYAFRRGVLT